MTMVAQFSRIALVAAMCLALGACRIPISQHALTSEMPGPVDERLLGKWEIDMTSLGGERGEKQLSVVEVRRVKDDSQRLEVVGLEGGVEKGDQVSAVVTCHYAMHDYLSFGPLNKSEGQGFAICRYELDDAEHGKLYLLDSDYMIDAIDRSLIAGEVKREGLRVTSVSISAKAPELREFLHKRSPACFATKLPLVAQRVK